MHPKYLFVGLLLIVFSHLQAQNNNQPKIDYNQSWKHVKAFEEKGLPASARKMVEEIYNQAKTENNASQLVKAIIHKIKYTEYKEEEAFKKNLQLLQKETETASFPAKPLLHSMLAEIYWQYYQNYRYQFNQRTETVNFSNDDLSTWSIEKIVSECVHQYELSLSNPDKLKATPLKVYNEVLENGNSLGLLYRPTLYDFLAHRAVDFYISNEPDMTQPAYAFNINSANYLTEAEKFTTLEITTRDTFSYKYYALRIFQDLIRFHLKDTNPDALVDVDLKRLQFVYQYLTLPDKQDLYLNALQKLESRTLSSPVSTLVTVQIAQLWNEKANEYKPVQSAEHKWDRKKAYEICNEAIRRYPYSNGSKMAYNLQQELKSKEIGAVVEKVNLPATPFKALISYRNIPILYWRVIPVTSEEVKAERRKWERKYDLDSEQKFMEHFISKTPVKNGKVNLPFDSDYQTHSIEIKLDALPVADYMIIFSYDANFGTENNGMAYAFTTVSNLAYMHRNPDDGTTDFYVVNRTTGEPIPGAKVQLYFNVYKNSGYELVKGDEYISDADGYIKVPYQNKKIDNGYYNSFEASFLYGEDKISTFYIDNYNRYSGQIYQSRTIENVHEQTHFFLDRAIYRPGQILYYKGLLTSTNGKTSNIIPKRNLTITFYDVNSQVVGKTDVTTNDFGSFSGTFTTPSSGLMGQMSLRVNDNRNSQVMFSVEEYKRPKFEVKFDTVKGSIKLGEDVKVKGKAMAYSGASIDGAAVKYRVFRRAVFPWWWWCWFGYYPASPEMEITSGTAVTDSQGTFEFIFKAIPDENVDRKSSPTFVYQVSADVTDINGESHSANTKVSAGYKALLLSVEIENLDISNEESLQNDFPIKTTNLAGEFEPASGSITIWKLKNPDRAYRERLWSRPDTFIYSKEEHDKIFPLDIYNDENNFYKWTKEKEVLSKTFDTSKDKTLSIDNLKKWDIGKYMLQIKSKDKFGEEVMEVAYFEVVDYLGKTTGIPEIFRFAGIKTSGEPGEKARIMAGSSEKLNYLYEIEQDGKILEKHRGEFKNQQKIFEIPIKEEFRGNIAVHMASIRNNRFYTQSQVINVPYTNKQLEIQFETFRDKLLPGQEEQWKIKISAKNADKAMAEMVATLYDASLDVFRMHNWQAAFYNGLYSRLSWQSMNGFSTIQFSNYTREWNDYDHRYPDTPNYHTINWFGYYPFFFGLYEEDMKLEEVVVAGYGTQVKQDSNMKNAGTRLKKESLTLTAAVTVVSSDELDVTSQSKPEEKSQDFSDVKVRKNFNETAFFYPHLQTNEQGEIIINFTIPEALTRWKMLGFAHTQDLKSGLIQKELVTQKNLMVVPNQPRFFRENDKMIFQAKINCMVDKDLEGQARLEFFDALTMKPVNGLLKITDNIRNFSIKARQSQNVEWSIEIPEGLQALTYRIVAKSGDFSDGEEMTLPVVTNRTLVTETLPLPIRGNQTKEFKFEKLLNNTSTTLKHQRFTLEFTSNPAWYAVQALPYLMEYPFECTEQLFSRFYANSIASHVANSNSKIKQVFDTWKNIQPDALLSNLEKNQELKTALLQETPWVLNAKSESQRKRNIALLFDLNKMASEQDRALNKIMEAQLGNGGFPWFPGLPEDLYITQYIVSGIGHLNVMGVKNLYNEKVSGMLKRAITYMDNKMADRYNYLKAESKKGRIKLEDNHLGYYDIQYLYARSYFLETRPKEENKEAFEYWIKQSKKYWLKQNLYAQGMLALALKRNGETLVPSEIIQSLKERALTSEEMGMYWKLERGFYWYQAPIETQALMIEVFDEVANDKKAVEDLKVWLLKQKQTQDWRTTKATSEACYALLRHGTDILANDHLAEITIAGKKIDPAKLEDTKIEAGTGYFKTAWTASEITPEMGNIKVKKTGDGVAWGAVYWQYFEQLDKITTAETPLKLSKKLFKQLNTERGPVITPISDTTQLKIGDLVKVRVELRADRTMEYIHLKDMRAAAFEPVETLSGFKYQDGLWYYQSPGDLATNFFIGYLPKGTYVFEYSLRVSQVGDFSNGITTIQCMYAPEFSSHSEGVRVKVKR